MKGPWDGLVRWCLEFQKMRRRRKVCSRRVTMILHSFANMTDQGQYMPLPTHHVFNKRKEFSRYPKKHKQSRINQPINRLKRKQHKMCQTPRLAELGFKMVWADLTYSFFSPDLNFYRNFVSLFCFFRFTQNYKTCLKHTNELNNKILKRSRRCE